MKAKVKVKQYLAFKMKGPQAKEYRLLTEAGKGKEDSSRTSRRNTSC